MYALMLRSKDRDGTPKWHPIRRGIHPYKVITYTTESLATTVLNTTYSHIHRSNKTVLPAHV